MADESVEALLGKRFIARRDVKAVQHQNGAYSPDCALRGPHDSHDCDYRGFTMTDLRAHTAGSATYGHYLLDQENKCKFFCFDIDLDQTGQYRDDTTGELQDCNPRDVWKQPEHPARPDLMVQLRCLAEGLAARVTRMFDIPVAISYSGNKGFHTYGFTGYENAADVRALAIEVLMDPSTETFERVKGEHFWKHKVPEAGLSNATIEVFPKQDTLDGKDFGNLMRLPLGIHRKSNQRAFFIDHRAPYDVLAEADALTTLRDGIDWKA